MLSLTSARERVAVVVPVYFRPSVEEEQIRAILEGTFQDHAIFCEPANLILVVDRGTRTEKVLTTALRRSSFYGLNLVFLERNRGKAGAVAAGLRQLLSMTDRPFLVTRDCDGDHVLEDLPRLVTMGETMILELQNPQVCVIGSRPSLEKPMGWVRQEWELLTNRILLDLIDFRSAQDRKVLDKRFWSGFLPDIQSGYRLYSRDAAQATVQCLESLPDDPELLALACEFVPFADLHVRGGVFGQVQRLTLVEQPVSSFSQVPFGRTYGRLLSYVTTLCGVAPTQALTIFDNNVVNSPLYFTDHRERLLECRARLEPSAPGPILPRFL